MCKINGKKLEEVRVGKGISQRDLASAIGLNQKTISCYETNRHDPSEETVDKICMILDINKDDIKIHDVGFTFSIGESKTVAHKRKEKGFVRFLKPYEVEDLIRDKCKNKDAENDEVKIALSNTFGIGKKRYMLIDPTFLHIPEWQRDTDMAKCTEIQENYQEEKFDPVKVYIKDGKLYVADGAHRVIAVIYKGEMKILVEVLNCTEIDATLIFLGQTAGRKPMSFSDTYRAGVKANLEEYLLLKHFFELHNIQITTELNRLDSPIGTISPSRALLRMLKNDKDMTDKVVAAIKKLEWTGSNKNAFSLRNLQVMRRMFIVFGDEVESKLLDYCKGAVFYESKVVPVKSNAELFDMLSEEISK